MRNAILTWTAAFALLGGTPAAAVTVTRVPYLNQVGPDTITVRWRTDVAEVGRVRYGTIQGSPTATADDPAATTEHEITLSSLAANTRYYYSIGNAGGVLAGGDANHYFDTPPAAGTRQPARVWIIGDSGMADANARSVRDGMRTWTGSSAPNLLLMLGDNAYNSGTDAEYQAAVFDTYPTVLRNTPLFSTRGNHETSAAVYYPRPRGYIVWPGIFGIRLLHHPKERSSSEQSRRLQLHQALIR